MKTVIFLQARMGSTRLPKKVLFPLEDGTVLSKTVERLRYVRGAEVILLTGPLSKNKKLVDEAKKIGIKYFCGSEENLLDRFYRASLHFRPQTIVRVTADCPLIDPGLIERGLSQFNKRHTDLLLNGRSHTFPHGLEYEVFTPMVLERHWRSRRAEFRSLALFLKTFVNPTDAIPALAGVRVRDIRNAKKLGRMRWTLDYESDYAFIVQIYSGLYRKNSRFAWRDVLRYLAKNPALARINAKHIEKGRA